MLQRTLQSCIQSCVQRTIGSGSGGGADPDPPAFTPFDIAGLHLGLDADVAASVLHSIGPDVPATSGQTVRRWLDQGDGDWHAEQTLSSANEPTLAAFASAGNAIRFDGSNDHLKSTFGGTVDQPVTIFLVASSTGDGYFVDGIATNRRHIIRRVSGVWSIFAGTALTAPNAVDSNPHIFTAVFNGATSRLFIDGALVASGDVGAQTITGLTLGMAFNTTQFVAGDIADLWCYAGIPTDDEIAQMNQYLATKRSLTLTE